MSSPKLTVVIHQSPDDRCQQFGEPLKVDPLFMQAKRTEFLQNGLPGFATGKSKDSKL